MTDVCGADLESQKAVVFWWKIGKNNRILQNQIGFLQKIVQYVLRIFNMEFLWNY